MTTITPTRTAVASPDDLPRGDVLETWTTAAVDYARVRGLDGQVRVYARPALR